MNKERLLAKAILKLNVWILERPMLLKQRLELIRILLAYATHYDVKLHQMGVKGAFLNGPLQEEVYVEKPLDFEDSKFPNHVYKIHKVLYGLKQAPRAWYECLKDFLLKNGFEIGKVDSTVFIQRNGKDIIICQIYVDDITLGLLMMNL
jgi:hypothetical protein